MSIVCGIDEVCFEVELAVTEIKIIRRLLDLRILDAFVNYADDFIHISIL